MRSLIVAGFALVFVSSISCVSDVASPAAPQLDGIAATTSLDHVVVSGRAEYLASVTVSGGANLASGSATADTGDFAIDVPLAIGTNTLIVVATDSDGNKGAPATATIVREEPRAEVVRITLESAIVNADQGTVAVDIDINNDERAVDLSALGITLSITGYAKAIDPVNVSFDSTGHGRGLVTGLDVVGFGVLHAEATVAAPDGSKASADSGFVVLAGAPVSMTLALTATVDGAPVGPANAISVPPNTPVDATASITDTAGNFITGKPLALAILHADADVIGSQILNVAKAGTYTVVASLGEGLLAATAALTVLPGAPVRIELTLTPTDAVAGTAIAVTARVVDAQDNVISGIPVDITADVPAVDRQGNAQALVVTEVTGGADGAITVRSAGVFTFTAGASGLPDLAAVDAFLVVSPGPIVDGTITSAPSPLPAGAALTVSAAFVDQFNNPVTSFFSVATDAPGAIISRNRVIGITLASDGGPPYTLLVTSGGGEVTVAADLVVVAATPDHIVLSPSSTTAVAGAVVDVAASIVDRFGNRVRTATPLLSETSPQSFDPAPTIVDGLATASITLTTAGSFVVSASASGVAAASAPLIVVPASIVAGTVTPSPTPVAAGATTNVAASFVDAFGNAVASGFTVATDAPDAIIIGNSIAGVTRASDGGPPYTLFVRADAGGAVFTGAMPVIAAAPARMVLTTSAVQPIAGTTVTAQAEVQDAFGNRVRTAAPSLSETSPQNFSPPPTSVNGLTVGTITVTSAGSFSITATDDGAGLVASASVALNVAHAAPLNANFFDIDPVGLPYLAGDSVLFTFSFQDGFGNTFFDVPLAVSVNSPNVTVTTDGAGRGQIDGIVRAGNYTVRARAIGTGLADNLEPLTVGPNPQNAGFNLALSAGLISERGTALFFVTDGFGNALATASVALSFTGAATPSQNGNQLTFPLAGTYSVKACLVANAATCDTEFISVQGIVDTVPPTVSVTVTFPSVGGVPPGGLVTFRVVSSDDRGLAELRFVATFGNDALGNTAFCTTQSASVLLSPGTRSDTRTFSFALAGCAVPLDEVKIVAQAIDQAGNSANSPPHAPLRVAAPFTITTQAGFIVSVAAFQDRLNQPQDVVSDPASGQLFVSNFGDDRVIVVAPDRTQADLLDRGGGRISPVQPRGVTRDATGNLFIHTRDPGGNNGLPGVERVRPDLTDNAPFIDSAVVAGSYPSIATGIALDETAGKTALMCAAVEFADRVQCFSNFSAAVVTPSLIINTALAGTRPLAPVFDPPSAGDAADRLWIALNTTRQIRQFTFNAARTTLTLVSNIDVSSAVGTDQMGDMVIAANTENFIVTRRNTGQVLRVTQGGVITVLASGFSNPVGLAFDGGSLLLVDAAIEAVFRLTPDPASPGVF